MPAPSLPEPFSPHLPRGPAFQQGEPAGVPGTPGAEPPSPAPPSSSRGSPLATAPSSCICMPGAWRPSTRGPPGHQTGPQLSRGLTEPRLPEVQAGGGGWGTRPSPSNFFLGPARAAPAPREPAARVGRGPLAQRPSHPIWAKPRGKPSVLGARARPRPGSPGGAERLPVGRSETAPRRGQRAEILALRPPAPRPPEAPLQRPGPGRSAAEGPGPHPAGTAEERPESRLARGRSRARLGPSLRGLRRAARELERAP